MNLVSTASLVDILSSKEAGGRRQAAALGVLALAFELFMLAHPAGTRWFPVTDDMLLALSGALAAASSAGRCRREIGRARQAWALLGAGCASFALGQIGFAYDAWRSVHPGVSTDGIGVADVLSILAILVSGAGLLLLYGRSPLASRWLAALDTVVITGAAGFLGWSCALARPYHASHRSEVLQATTIFYVAGSLALLVIALLLAARWPGDLPTLLLLGAGFASVTVANVGYALLAIHSRYETGNPFIDVLWFGAFLLVAAAAARPAQPRQDSADLARQWMLALAIPTVSAVVVIATTVLMAATGQHIDVFTRGLVAVVVLAVLFRQFVTLVENRSLTLDLDRGIRARTAELAHSQQRFERLVQHSSDVIVVVDRSGVLTYVSAAASHVLGYSHEFEVAASLYDFVHPEDVPAARELLEGLRETAKIPTLTVRLRHADGTYRHVEARASVLPDAVDQSSLVLNIRDVTDRAELERQLRHQAQHDPLTGLANRTLFHDRVHHAVQRMARTHQPVAVLYVDLDNFKRLNDSRGHAEGDRALVRVAEVIATSLRPSDTAARLGGDEFAILLEETSEQQAREVGERLVSALHDLEVPSGQSLVAGASVGVAITQSAATDSDSLLRDADVAMYQAKSAGRGRLAVLTPTTRAELVQQLALEESLAGAVERGELSLAYQPIVSITDGAIVGIEALARWRGPGGEPVPPSLFIPLAEETGLIVELDRWVLRRACEQCHAWFATLPEDMPFTLNVNLSAADLHDDTLAASVVATLGSSHLPPRRLMLEVTETSLPPQPSSVARQLHALRETGAHLSLDDFGTGYSSMSTLSLVPLDELKIDGSFVSDLLDGPRGVRLVRGILHFAHSLNLHVVAEAVESREQLDILGKLNCDSAQGFLFSPPRPWHEIEPLLVATVNQRSAS